MNRVFLIVLAVVVALALLFVFVVNPLLLQDAEDVAGPVPLPTTGAAQATPEPTAEPPVEAEPVPETFEVFAARDPFQQLVSDATAAGATGGTAAVAPAPAAQAPPSTGTPAPPSGSQVGGTTVRLVDVITDAEGQPAVLVTINGTGYEANEGEVFGQRFRVLDIDTTAECATFLFGDSRFVLCAGEEIRK